MCGRAYYYSEEDGIQYRTTKAAPGVGGGGGVGRMIFCRRPIVI